MLTMGNSFASNFESPILELVECLQFWRFYNLVWYWVSNFWKLYKKKLFRIQISCTYIWVVAHYL